MDPIKDLEDIKNKNLLDLIKKIEQSKQVDLMYGYIKEKAGCDNIPFPSKELIKRYSLKGSGTIELWGILENYFKINDMKNV